MIDKVRYCHNVVWNFREVAGAEPIAWNTPTPDDCVRYASQEINEALSAYMKMERDHARNHPLSKSAAADNYVQELAQTLIMLLSIVLPKYLEIWVGFCGEPKQVGWPMLTKIDNAVSSMYQLYLGVYRKPPVESYAWARAVSAVISAFPDGASWVTAVENEIELLTDTKIRNNQKLTAEAIAEKLAKLAEMSI